MPQLSTSIGTTITTRTKIVQLQHVNRQTVDAPSLSEVIETGTLLQALDGVTIHAIDGRGISVLQAMVKIKYRDGVPEFELLSKSDDSAFLSERSFGQAQLPEPDKPYCDIWRGVLEEYMRICRAMGYDLRWTVQLTGIHAQEVRDQHGLSNSSLVVAATQSLSGALLNSQCDEMSLSISGDPDVAKQTMPGST